MYLLPDIKDVCFRNSVVEIDDYPLLFVVQL